MGPRPGGICRRRHVASGRRPRCRAGRRDPCRCTCGRAPSRRWWPPSASPRRRPRSARRSRHRASRDRAAHRMRRRDPPDRPSNSSASPANPRMSGMPMFTPFATPTANTSGTRWPSDRHSARPATRPACVPPLDDVCTTAAGLDPRRGALLHQFDERRPRTRVRRRRCCRRSESRTAPRRRRQRVGERVGERPSAHPSGSRGRRCSAVGRRTAPTAVGCRPDARVGRRTAPGEPRSRALLPPPPSADSGSIARRRRSRATGRRRAIASPHRNSSLRTLLPPMPRPVRSSRLNHSRCPPGSSGPRSSGVGSSASDARGR